MLLDVLPRQFRTLRRVIFLSAVVTISAAGAAVAAPVSLASLNQPIEGAWRTLNGTEVTVVPCEAGFCGYLSWIVIPMANSAQCQADRVAFAAQMIDRQNPDPSLRTRSLIGMQMLTIKPTGNPTVFDGSIYNAEDGKSYDGVIEIVDQNTMKLGNGCVFGLCVVTQEWPRVPVRSGPADFTCDGST